MGVAEHLYLFSVAVVLRRSVVDAIVAPEVSEIEEIVYYV